MADIVHIRRTAATSNLRPVSDPSVTAEALASMFDSVGQAQAENHSGIGMSSLRRAIMKTIARAYPDASSMAELRLATGVPVPAIQEHIRSLRWKGLIMLESLTLSPSALPDFTMESLERPHR